MFNSRVVESPLDPEFISLVDATGTVYVNLTSGVILGHQHLVMITEDDLNAPLKAEERDSIITANTGITLSNCIIIE